MRLKFFTILQILALLAFAKSASAQCSGCTYTAPSGGTNFNFNGNETLCITANTGQIGWNMNGSNNTICLATGVVWDQPFGGNFGNGAVVDIYGTLNLSGGVNVNGTATFNIHPGGVVNRADGGFGNGLTINNEGTFNFLGATQSFTGTFVFNNMTGGSLNALEATLFEIGNNATFNNVGTMHIANLENGEGYLNNNVGGTLIVDRNMNNHGAFINNGDFQLPCNTIVGPPGMTVCSFRVGDKGVGKEFISNTCMSVLNGNVTFDGPGTLNAGLQVGAGYNLTLNKTVTGTNGSIRVEGGTSTISLSGNLIGTNMKFYDVNTAGNDFDVKNGNDPTNYTVDAASGCSAPPPTCAIAVTSATPSVCNPGTNTYSVDVIVTYSNPPTGNINVSTSNGGSVSIAQTTSPQTITLTGLAADELLDIDVTAVFANDAACTHTLMDCYDAPANCFSMPCPVPNCGTVTTVKN